LTLIERDLKIARGEQIVLLTICARLLEVILAVKHHHEWNISLSRPVAAKVSHTCAPVRCALIQFSAYKFYASVIFRIHYSNPIQRFFSYFHLLINDLVMTLGAQWLLNIKVLLSVYLMFI